MSRREHWKSQIGFIWSVIGSAVGLGSIWRFPYVVGQNGGAIFVILFVLFLVLISLPVFLGEIVIGKTTQKNPHQAFLQLGKAKPWGWFGLGTIITGFIVSSFYSVVCGWTLGYLVKAIFGNLTHFTNAQGANLYFQNLVETASWSVGTHFAFMFFACLMLYFGVRKGIEAGNKIFMPLLFFILIVLAIQGLTMSGAKEGLKFLFTPDWSALTPGIVIMALGQAFFSLSIGQGTMVTYGSYLTKKDNIPLTGFPITVAVTIVSLLAGIAIFPAVFSIGLMPDEGVDLMFKTLPLVFSKITGGYFISILFFLLIFSAGITSLISALEPLVAFLIDEKNFSRHQAVFWVGIGAFLLGVPSALSFGVWKSVSIFGTSIFLAVVYLSVNILVPIGGLGAVILIGWRWGVDKAKEHLLEGAGKYYRKWTWLQKGILFSIRYVSPIVILIIFLQILGIF